MKYRTGDRVSCKFGSGKVIRAKEENTSLPFNVYFIKMISPEKYKGLEMLFAEQELEIIPQTQQKTKRKKEIGRDSR